MNWNKGIYLKRSVNYSDISKDLFLFIYIGICVCTFVQCPSSVMFFNCITQLCIPTHCQNSFYTICVYINAIVNFPRTVCLIIFIMTIILFLFVVLSLVCKLYVKVVKYLFHAFLGIDFIYYDSLLVPSRTSL